MPTPRRGAPVANRLLAALPNKDYQRLLPELELVPLAFGDILYEPGDTIGHVYFPRLRRRHTCGALRPGRACQSAYRDIRDTRPLTPAASSRPNIGRRWPPPGCDSCPGKRLSPA